MPLKRVVWKPEEKVYIPLQMVYGENRVLPKVRMIDVIAAEDHRFTKEERDYLFMAHFDFVVVDSDLMPIFACELDGRHHFLDKKQIDGVQG